MTFVYYCGVVVGHSLSPTTKTNRVLSCSVPRLQCTVRYPRRTIYSVSTGRLIPFNQNDA